MPSRYLLSKKALPYAETLDVVLYGILAFATSMSVVALRYRLTQKPSPITSPLFLVHVQSTFYHVMVTSLVSNSLTLSVVGWTCVSGLVLWRGRLRSIWAQLGFDQDVFALFVKMRGARTRLKLLQSLSVPKNRSQLASDIGCDWKAVDRHVEVLEKYGFIKESENLGTAKFYELTQLGMTLLELIAGDQLR